MHSLVFYLTVVWQLALVAVLAIYTLRARSVVDRVVAFDTLAIVFVATLGTVAIHDSEAGYLDIGLVLAMLGFAQTVATVRLLERTKGVE